MKEERIIRALNDVDDKYILEAMPGKKKARRISWKKIVGVAACLILLIALSTIAYAANWFGIRNLLLPHTNPSDSGTTEETEESETEKETETETDTESETETETETVQDMTVRKVYAATLRNLLYSNILPDGSTAESAPGAASQFAMYDVDGDGREELVLLYDPGIVSDETGYIIDYDKDTEKIYIQLEEFPAFAFLENGNVKALSSHNQTYGDMWPYMLYRYVSESDSYEVVGYVFSEDKSRLEENGWEAQYPQETDVSGTGTVYYIGTDSWGTEPVDETDYIAWLSANQSNVEEVEIPFRAYTEENIAALESGDVD